MSNWEDRLKDHPVIKEAGSNWEDRMRTANLEPPPIITGQPSTVQILNPTGGRNFDTGIPIPASATDFLAGAGKAYYDMARGIGQKIGLVSDKDIAAARSRDEQLLATRPGFAGNLAGGVASALPAAAIPGANTLAGATAIGAGLGVLQPAESVGELAKNTAIGAASGPLGNLAGRGIGALAGAVKGVVDPFTQAGRNRIVGDVLRRFSTDPAAAATNMANARVLVPGSNPTAGQTAMDAGIAQLEHQASQLDPIVDGMMKARAAEQNAARVAAVRSVGKDAVAREAAVQARRAATRPLYQHADAVVAPVDQTLADLLKRPSMGRAMGQAQSLASETGVPIRMGKDLPATTVSSGVLDANGNPIVSVIPAQTSSVTGRGMQYLDMAIDDMIKGGPQQGIGAHELRALANTRQELNNWINSANPAYGQASQEFARLSRPINQIDIGTRLAETMIPAIQDFGASGGLYGNRYAAALRNGDAVAAKVTGFPRATMASTMEPAQIDTLNAVGQDLARSATANSLAATHGSPTARNLVSQNLISSIAGPLGLPAKAIADNAAAQSLLKLFQFLAGQTEPRVLEGLAAALLNPSVAAQRLSAAQSPQIARALAEALQKYGTAALPAVSVPMMGQSVSPAAQ